MKKKLLVVGDSFMRPDPDYPGQHWSEMLPDYEIIMNSQSGSSNGIIAYNFYQGLSQNPDAVVLGFTFPSRLEFATNIINGQEKIKWTTNVDRTNITTDQQLAADLYAMHTDDEMRQLKETTIACGILSILRDRKIPFAWTLNGLFNNLANLPYPSDPWINLILSDYFDRMTPTNLTTYQGFKTSPGFHTDDPEWQQRFASEVQEILQTQLTYG
jgi:hypothetical protein